MEIASDDTRLLRLRAATETFGLNEAQALSCLLWLIAAMGPRGEKVVADLRADADRASDGMVHVNLDDVAASVYMTTDELFVLWPTAIADYADIIKAKLKGCQ
jgi:hypothetical protein